MTKNTLASSFPTSKLPVYIFCFFLSLYTLTAQGSIQTSDGRIMFLLTESMVERHRLSFHENYLTSSKASVTPGSKEQYSKYGLGLSVMAIPFYIIGKTLSSLMNIDPRFTTMFCVSMVNILMTALTCVIVFRFARERLMFSDHTAVVLSLAYGSATMAWAHSEEFMSEPATALFLLCAVYFITDTHQKSRSTILAGSFLGLAILVRLASVIALPAFVVYITHAWMNSSPKKPKDLALDLARLGVPIFLFVDIIFIYNYIRFDNIFESGYDSDFRANILLGLYGLLLSPGKSFFLYNPPAIIGLLGVSRLFKQYRGTAILFGLLALTHIFFYSFWGSWHGGNSWGPRFLLVILPYLVLPAGFVGLSRIKWAAVFAIALAIQIPAITVNIARYDYHMKVKFGVLPSNEMILFSPIHSPVIGQAREVAIVFRNLQDKALMERLASQALAKKSFFGASYEDILENALALNVPNFWWFYMHLFGFPLTFLPPALLFLLTLFFGKKIYTLNKT